MFQVVMNQQTGKKKIKHQIKNPMRLTFKAGISISNVSEGHILKKNAP
jgi:hypothetical protein